MKHINEEKINKLINLEQCSREEFDNIIAKSKQLKRLTTEESAKLLNIKDKDLIKIIFETAEYVKNTIYGKRVVLFVPLYINNICTNECLYCSFCKSNKTTIRKKLTIDEIKEQTRILLERGHKRILMLSSESANENDDIEYFVKAIEAIYSVNVGKNKVKRINVNLAPLSIENFKKLKKAGIGTYQIFQETYHEDTYRKLHGTGPKSDPDNRLDAIDRAFKAGIDDIGIGPLYGLYNHKFETLAMFEHISYLEKEFGLGPHVISVPRLEPAYGSELSNSKKYAFSDEDFKQMVAVIRLSVPYTGIIMSTRETAEMRNELLNLGVSQISAESRVSPGGYERPDDHNAIKDVQFQLNDQRSIEEVVSDLIKYGYIPSFCAACYRRERTGKVFMSIAKPGNIKEKCTINALITFKEYLEDFADEEFKKQGNKLIENKISELSDYDREVVNHFFENIKKGNRDEFI
ncbi:MAG: [FeFe] hydrogenase H-cluster radical SAM maturase HydG [Endomicrobiia bacterium]